MSRSWLQLFGRIAIWNFLGALAIWVLRRVPPALAWPAVLAIASWPARQWLIDKGADEIDRCDLTPRFGRGTDRAVSATHSGCSNGA